MTHEVRERSKRPATPEEKARHDQIRNEIADETSELKTWAKSVAAEHKNRVGVGTVFDANETQVVDAIDAYASKHSLPSRGAVVREALAHLLGIEITARG